MAEIHGLTAAGEWVIGVEVFRRLYAAVGFSLLVWPTRLPGVSHLMDWGYGIFARNRVKWFSRCNDCLLYTSPSPRDKRQSRMPSSA